MAASWTNQNADSWMRRLKRVLRHGSLFDTGEDEESLRSSLRVWLATLGAPRSVPSEAARTSVVNQAGRLPIPSNALKRTLRGHGDAVFQLTYSPDGTQLTTTSHDGTARIWNPTTGETLLHLVLSTSRGVAWHGDQLALAAARHWISLDIDLERAADRR